MQDTLGNEAIQKMMAEEMSPEECSRYEMWVPEVQQCLATGAAPNSAMGNALIALISTKLAGAVAGGVLGSAGSSTLAQKALKVSAVQAGGVVSSWLGRSGNSSSSAANTSEEEETLKTKP